MTLENSSYITQIIGLIVVIVTLSYLSAQVKQGKELLRSDSRQGQLTNDQAGVSKFVDDPRSDGFFHSRKPLNLKRRSNLSFESSGR